MLRELERSYTNLFAGRVRLPRFKRKAYPSGVRFTLDQRCTQVDRGRGHVQLDGVGRVKFKLTEDIVGRLRSATMNRDGACSFFNVDLTADGVLARKAPAAEAVVGVNQGCERPVGHNLPAIPSGSVGALESSGEAPAALSAQPDPALTRR